MNEQIIKPKKITMKKSKTTKWVGNIPLFIALLILIAYASLQFDTPKAMSYASAPPAGYAGAPANGMITCNTSGCHSGTATQNANGWITSNIPGTGYVPGNTYTITATATYAGRNTFGFEISPQNASGTKLGTLINTSTQTGMAGTGYIGQKSNGLSGSGSKTWTFDWQAPTAGSGSVTFYGAFNCANGNGGTSGDFIYTSTLTVQEVTTGVEMVNSHDKISVYPNPSSGVINITNTNEVTVMVYSYIGKLVRVYKNTNRKQFDLSELEKGVYFINIQTGKIKETKKIILSN